MNAQAVTRAGRASKPSLEAVFEAEQSPLLRYAYSLVGRREVAEEVVQEAFLSLHRHWDGVVHPRSWLFRCVRNRAYNHLRDHKREVLSESGVPDRGADSEGESRRTAGAEAPDEVLGRMEAAGMLHVLLGELPKRDRELVHLKYVEGLSYSAISGRTGMTVGNVGYRLHHVLRGLADDLRRSGVEGVRG